MAPIAAVFDLDDTLIASDRARLRKLRQLLGPGVDLHRVQEVARECWEAYQRGDCTWDEQRRRRWTAIGIPEERALEVDDAYRAHYETIRIRPGARALLTGLKDRDVRLALMSNSQPSYVESRLREHRLGGVFEFVFQMIPPRRKPQPEVFLETVEQLGVPAGQAVIVGNDLEVDVLPALGAGYRHGYWMTRSACPVPTAVTRVRTCIQLSELLLR
ncbi:MAG: HAD family hydrolase [Candidatus Dormibacteraeota bacterium]|nr:HAD family hydrolase [Candidatus Dormibacteraeota bacterium]